MIRPRAVSETLSLFPARTPTLPPATHTNSYALGGRDVLLVEPATPFEDEQREWIAWAEGLVSQGRRPVGLLATHHHPDHIGGLDVLASRLGVGIWAHDETARLANCTLERSLSDGDTIVLDGPRPETWVALLTPGHAPGHICLWNADSRTLVVGDMVASQGTILIAPGEGDMGAYLEQLDRLASFEATLALPAHGDPIVDPTKLFRRYITHRLLRERHILESLKRVEATGDNAGAALDSKDANPTSGTTLGELLPHAYGDTPQSLWPFASLSLQAHLEKLIQEGKVRLFGDRYSLQRGA